MKELGKIYIVFLTADHAAVEVPAYLESVNIPAGYFDTKGFIEKAKDFVEEKYGDKNLIENISNDQVFFNYGLLDQMGIESKELQEKLAAFILSQDKIHRVYTRNQIVSGAYEKVWKL